LHGDEAQAAFAEFGFRPVNRSATIPASVALPRPADLFTVADLGGWNKISAHLFGPQGLWTKAVEELARGG
jgi:sulfate transport system substrate-binding protein